MTQQLKDWDDTSTSAHSEGDESSHVPETIEVSRNQFTGRLLAVKQPRNAWDDSATSDSEHDEVQQDQSIRDSTKSPEIAGPQDSWEDSSSASSAESENSEVWSDSPMDDPGLNEQTPPTVLRKAMSDSNVEFLEVDGELVIRAGDAYV